MAEAAEPPSLSAARPRAPRGHRDPQPLCLGSKPGARTTARGATRSATEGFSESTINRSIEGVSGSRGRRRAAVGRTPAPRRNVTRVLPAARHRLVPASRHTCRVRPSSGAGHEPRHLAGVGSASGGGGAHTSQGRSWTPGSARGRSRGPRATSLVHTGVCTPGPPGP